MKKILIAIALCGLLVGCYPKTKSTNIKIIKKETKISQDKQLYQILIRTGINDLKAFYIEISKEQYEKIDLNTTFEDILKVYSLNKKQK